MQTTQLPYCIQIIQATGPTSIAFAALVITGYFAWRQWRTAKDKLVLDLFEKRFLIFEALMTLLANSLAGSKTASEAIPEFMRKTKGVEFVFEGEIKEYLESIRRKVSQMSDLEKELADITDESKRKAMINDSSEIHGYLERQFADEAVKKFRKYLALTHTI